MKMDSPVIYYGTSESQKNPQTLETDVSNNSVLNISKEEKEILRICNRESFYYRCLPLAGIFMASTQVLIKMGHLSRHPVWGSTLKMTGAGFAAWIIGKWSYRKKCEDKFVTLKNSPIADIIRKRRGITLDGEFASDSTEDYAGLHSYTSQTDDYHSSSGSLNLDVDKNIQYSGLDDRERPSTDRETMTLSEEIEPATKSTTYEDLRRTNREEYEKSQRSYSARPDQTFSPPLQRPRSNADAPPVRRYSTDPSEGATKNKYGDSWDNAKFL